jgi:hypothetical protein
LIQIVSIEVGSAPTFGASPDERSGYPGQMPVRIPDIAAGYNSCTLVKIAGRRQDADVAGVTDFLRRRIGVVAAVVVERLDQR